MSLFIHTNISSLKSINSLANTTRKLDVDYQRLSSGYRINSAKDDAAGLQISDRMTSQINGLNQGCKNAQDAISMLQTAEGALDETTNCLQRIRVLAVQSANGVNSKDDRISLQQEVSQLSLEINRIAKDTTYAGAKIFDGEQAYKYNKEGSAYKDPITGSTIKDSFKTLKPISKQHPNPDVSCRDVNHTSKSFSYQVGADANQTIDVVFGLHTDKVFCDAGCKGVFSANAYLGFDLNGLYLTSGEPNTLKTRIIDMDEPYENHTTGYTIGSDGLVSLDVSTSEAAQNVLKYIDGYIQTIDGKRAEFGAVQNRLESAIRNEKNIIENVSSARSQIRDTDYAEVTSQMIKDNIIVQASQTVLAQANNIPELALSLLKGM
ncbi:MAG: flagellin [Succinivibrionaceae bacterium]